MKYPVVELSDCILCGICEEISPMVFHVSDLGYVQVTDLLTYPESEVEDAIKHCPVDCISWEEG
jgi:ferredoxin